MIFSEFIILLKSVLENIFDPAPYFMSVKQREKNIYIVPTSLVFVKINLVNTYNRFNTMPDTGTVFNYYF